MVLRIHADGGDGRGVLEDYIVKNRIYYFGGGDGSMGRDEDVRG